MIHVHVEVINFLVNLVFFLPCESEVTRCGLCDFAIACVVLINTTYVSTVAEIEPGRYSMQLKS